MDYKTYWKGIIPALLTPLNADETLNVEQLEKLIERLLDSGCEGIFAAGSTGEPTNLREEVYFELVQRVLSIVNGRVPVCVGVLEPGTARCIDTIKKVQEFGVDFVSCTPNFYAKNEYQDDIIRHYEALSRKTDVKMMIYNNLGTTGVDIMAPSFFEIAQFDNVVAYKDTRSDWENHMRSLYFLRDKNISLINGGEYLIGASFLMGSQGNIAAASNVLPKLFVTLYQAAKAKDIDKTLELSDQVARLNEITRTGCGWLHGVKYAASRLGVCDDIVAGSTTPLTPEAKRKVDTILDELSAWA